MAEKLDQVYANIMKAHPFGIAMYRPLPSSIFSPGSCGYFDHTGSWNMIAHLEDSGLLRQRGLEPLDRNPEKAPLDDGITWGPMVSSNIKATNVSISGGIAPVAGIPITASAIQSYVVDKDVGAVLLTSSPVTHEHYYGASTFTSWCKKNARSILKHWPEVKEHGLWIITSTYSAKKCAIKLSVGKGKEFQVGFAVNAAGLGQAGPSGEWHWSQTDQGWGEYTADGKDRSVVFFGGLKFLYTRLLHRDLKPISGTPKFRGGNVITAVIDPEDEQSSFDVQCEKHLGPDDDDEIAEREEEW